jgi:hypothetical protein
LHKHFWQFAILPRQSFKLKGHLCSPCPSWYPGKGQRGRLPLLPPPQFRRPWISVYLRKQTDISAGSCQTSLHINNIDWEVFWLFICFKDLYISLKNISPLLDE